MTALEVLIWSAVICAVIVMAAFTCMIIVAVVVGIKKHLDGATVEPPTINQLWIDEETKR